MIALTTSLDFTSTISSTESFSVSSTVVLNTEQKPLEQVIVIYDNKNFIFVKSISRQDFSTVGHSTADNTDSSQSIYLTQQQKECGINYYHIDVLESLKILKHGWDGDDAIAPSSETVEAAISFAKYLQSVGEKIYHVAPGPVGEIMIELRSGENSIEFLFYPNKLKYVLFSNERPVQGLFDNSMLSNLLVSLHA